MMQFRVANRTNLGLTHFYFLWMPVLDPLADCGSDLYEMALSVHLCDLLYLPSVSGKNLAMKTYAFVVKHVLESHVCDLHLCSYCRVKLGPSPLRLEYPSSLHIALSYIATV